MSECRKATNGADKVRNLQRALYRKSKQEKEARVDSRDDKVWREDVLWEAWRQVKAHHGAPGVEGKAIEEMVATGQEETRIEQWQTVLRAHHDQCAPVRVGERPKPTGGPRPLGIATGEDRVGQTAMKLVLDPIVAADFPDGSYGYRPKRDAKQASRALRADLYNQAWAVVEMDCQSDCTSIPHGKLLKLITKRMAAGSMLKCMKQTLQVGRWDKGQVGPTTIGVPQGSPISPMSSHISLPLLDHLWHSRAYPAKLGATLHRDAADALLVCRQSARPALAAFEAIAKRMELPLNRDKTRETRLTEGCAFLGVEFVKRRSPTSGKNTISLFPAKSAPQKIRNKLQSLTSRRAPMRPQACVAQGHPVMRGWVNYVRHTNASHAFRELQRFVPIRFRRYLPQRSTGRGFGGKRSPNRKRYAVGLAYSGSGKLEAVAKPGHGVRCRLSDRRIRDI